MVLNTFEKKMMSWRKKSQRRRRFVVKKIATSSNRQKLSTNDKSKKRELSARVVSLSVRRSGSYRQYISLSLSRPLSLPSPRLSADSLTGRPFTTRFLRSSYGRSYEKTVAVVARKEPRTSPSAGRHVAGRRSILRSSQDGFSNVRPHGQDRHEVGMRQFHRRICPISAATGGADGPSCLRL